MLVLAVIGKAQPGPTSVRPLQPNIYKDRLVDGLAEGLPYG